MRELIIIKNKQAISRVIKQIRTERNLTRTQFATMAKVSVSTLKQIEDLADVEPTELQNNFIRLPSIAKMFEIIFTAGVVVSLDINNVVGEQNA